jgi:hypothetical protein
MPSPQRPKREKKQQPLNDNTIFECLQKVKGVTESTTSAYAVRLKKLCELVGDCSSSTNSRKLVQLIENASDTIELLRQAPYELRTRQGWCTAVCAVFKHAACASRLTASAASAWRAFNRELCTQISTIESHNTRSEHEERGRVTLQEALQAEAELRISEPGSARHLLLAWHCLWPPNRGGDSGLVWLVSSRAEADSCLFANKNVLILAPAAATPPLFLLRDHKTAKHSGTIVRTLPVNLASALAASFLAENVTNNATSSATVATLHRRRTCLFESPLTHTPFRSEKSYLAWATRTLLSIFGRPVTVNSLRHAFVNALDMQRMSSAKLEAVASAMGHTVRTQQRSYRRVEHADACDAEIIFRK